MEKGNIVKGFEYAKDKYIEIDPEEHSSVVVFGEDEGIPNHEFGEAAAELLDADVEPTLSTDELEQLRIEAGMPAWGKEIDDTILPAEAGLDGVQRRQ